MRARLIDSNGPTWTRAALPVVALLAMCVGLFGPWESSIRGFAFCATAAILFVGPILLGRRSSRDVTLEIGAGKVAVKDAGGLTQTIRARDICAASAARGASGIGFALVRGSREARPIVIDALGQEDAKALRDALGIGHYGLGTLMWPTATRAIDVWDVGARVVGGAIWALLAASAFTDTVFPVAMLSAVGLLPICCVLLLTAYLSRNSAGPFIALQPLGVNISSPGHAWRFVPYANIAGAVVVPGDAGGIRLDLHDAAQPLLIPVKPARHMRRGISEEERDHLVAQILSASQRAHGAGTPPPVVFGRVTDLAKGRERGRVWLARLDAAAEMLASGPGYRGAGFEEADLWTTLEDHDAPSDMRAAAARVLLRVAPEEAAKRVESVLAAVRDEPARARIRIAIDPDVELASRELDELDAREQRAQPYVR